MKAIKAIYDGFGFTPMQPIPVREKCEVIITFLVPTETKEESIPTPADYIEILCGSLTDYPEMSVDRFLERKRADKELDL